MAKDYDLDKRLNPEEINHKLSFLRRSMEEIQQINFADEYTPASAEENYILAVQKMLHGERDAVKDQYWQQGFLGRFLVYLMDRII